MTEASKKDKVVLKKVLCINYLLCFCKNKKNKVRILINLGSKVNIITFTYTAKLGLKSRLINVEAQKIDCSTLKIFKMILANF